MVPHRIAEIQARLNAATPGPWEECCPEWPCANIAARGVNVATAYSGRGDVAFIAAAPEDMRYLLERIAALETALQPLAEQDCESWGCLHTPDMRDERTCAITRARSVLAGLPHGQEQPQ